MLRLLCAVACVGLLCGAAAAQQVNDAAPFSGPSAHLGPQPGPDALGDLLRGPFDVEVTGGGVDVRCLGVEKAYNWYYVTGAGPGAGGPGLNSIYQFDLNGVWVATYLATTTSPFWGHRDGEADEASGAIYFGDEQGLHQYDINSGTGALSNHQVFTDPTGAVGTVRALAIDRAGAGNFFTANFSGSLFEFNLAGGVINIVNTYANPGIVFYGAGDDCVSGNMWGWGQDALNPACTTDRVTAQEFTNTGVATGQIWYGTSIGGCGATNIAGGFDTYEGDSANAGLSAVALHQAGPDSIAVYEISTQTCGGGPSCTLTNTPGSPCGVTQSSFTISPHNGQWAIYWSLSAGSTGVSIGSCNVNLGLGSLGPPKFGGPPVVLNGSTVSKKVPPAVCGTVQAQGVDLTNCCVTNVVTGN